MIIVCLYLWAIWLLTTRKFMTSLERPGRGPWTHLLFILRLTLASFHFNLHLLLFLLSLRNYCACTNNRAIHIYSNVFLLVVRPCSFLRGSRSTAPAAASRAYVELSLSNSNFSPINHMRRRRRRGRLIKRRFSQINLEYLKKQNKNL